MKHLKYLIHLNCLIAVLGMARLAGAQVPAQVSEKDFLGDVPVVLSVSRLPQRLDETPGAVTILDRQMIRMSGARDVADLFRLVPGFRVSSTFEGTAPQASYHTDSGDYSNHIQVMVDGRSVYSAFLVGSTGPGLQSVAIEDIERIEVLRGSNSATYGARAFLGTINIVTRDTADTQGAYASVSGGGNSIQDAMARFGWGDDRARFRLSADTRSDRGLLGTSGPDQVNRFNFRADLFPSASDQVEFRAGLSLLEAGVGFAGDSGNAVRKRFMDTGFFQLDWRRSLGQDEDFAVQLSRTQEKINDHFPYGDEPRITLNYGGQATNDNLLVQHSFRHNPDLRLVWGGELRRESIVSKALYGTDSEFVTDFRRLFSNVEWRFHKDMLLNLGGMFESSTLGGDHLAPRAMLNWNLADGHTLRYGVTNAFRPPSTFEKFSNVRYYLNGSLFAAEQVSRGNVSSERVYSRELSYLGEFPRMGVHVDVRIFEEEIRDSMRKGSYTLPGTSVKADDFANRYDYNIHGFEYQLRWKPWRDGQLVFSQAYVDTGWNDNGNLTTRPNATMSLMLMQRLPGQVDLSVMYSQIDRVNYPGGPIHDGSPEAPAMSRTDLRLAKQMRFGTQRGEISFVVQNLGPAYQDFIADFYFRRQAFVMLKLEN